MVPSMFLLDSIVLESVNQGGLWSKGTVKEFPYWKEDGQVKANTK